MTVLVTGARGHVGRAVVDALAAAGRKVRASSRDAAALDLPDGIEKVGIDLENPATLEGALDGVDAVFLYTRPQGIEGFVKAAEAAGVRHVVQLSSIGAREPAEGLIGKWHRDVEDALAASKVGHTALRPGTFATNALAWIPEIREGVVRMAYPDAQVGAIHEADMAAVAVRVILDGSHIGESLPLSGPASVSFREQIETLAEVVGRPVTIEELTPAQAMEQLAARGWHAGVAESILRFWRTAVEEPAEVTDVVREITGTAPRTFRQWAEDHRSDFAG
jgi:uncharacterized protein YbjT (DUF2867 family)